MKTSYKEIKPYITRDGSEIRELMHPDHHECRNQSIAEALIPEGETTIRHRHADSEEIYHITSGRGVMFLGDREFPVSTGDTVCISPGTPHKIRNTGKTPLRVLCCCSPAYSHDDTELL